MRKYVDNVECHRCDYLGEYYDVTDENEGYMPAMLQWYRENIVIMKRNNIKYTIKIVLTANRKRIRVVSETFSTVDEMLHIIYEILRFENLFEGLFFPLVSLKVDEVDYTKEVRTGQLEYYNSTKRYTYIPIDMDDGRYGKLYRCWLKVEKKNNIIHPVFLYATYLEGMPVDVRMALLLETFEPIAESLHNRGIITLVKPPTKTFKNWCRHCGKEVSKTVSNKELEFKDKLKPLLKKYGTIIFKGDSKTKLIAKSVKVRNKVDHVNANIENAMNGKQCGFYIYKFSLLYRYIMLQEIGVEVEKINPYIVEWVENFNMKFTRLRV